ncbi:alpha-2-macroglobulin family protein [Roseicyclus sp. F158]|uniref:Alpha-2-macroglobulin family protein n=1 Tax=Tropicimonas omnivorans TaxID=3075590 RepID=A0ABU3DCY7_9RHOB|nr:alpha-2-macroglobulin family protein [Roseicyclus sp. F158]MDT0681419.1 alpha-2-macroglobulin family protein [Roseicyclus sp. F158]
MLRPILAIIAFAALTTGALAQGPSEAPPIPERRIVVEEGTDFPGGDLRSIFDTTFEACRGACTADAECGAFTFNTRSNSCFPKRSVEGRAPYDGALSARLVEAGAEAIALAEQRAADLGDLPRSDLEAAREEALALPRRYPATERQVPELIALAANARSRNDVAAALALTGEGAARTGRADLWLDHAKAALVAAQRDGDTRQYAQTAINAALNAYLRSDEPSLGAAALDTLAAALERSGRGRDTIPVRRLAADLAPDGARDTALNEAIGQFGFRITETRAESDPAMPRICATFSESLARGVDFEPYVQVPGTSVTVEAEDQELCLEGVSHGDRYSITFRAGLPAEDGQTMARDATVTLYVRDRTPGVRFPGRAYVLPKTGDPGLPVVTVNLSEIDLTLYSIPDRNLRELMVDDLFGRNLQPWNEEEMQGTLSDVVWSGTGEVGEELNADVTTRLPMGEAIGALPAGLYALQASVPGADPYDTPPATQWFVISDIGLASYEGTDGTHVFARSLADGTPSEGLSVQLVSRSNRVLGEAETDEAGHAVFAPGLSQGRDGAAPALVVAEARTDGGAEDMAFLSLTDPEFDLADRGVAGRAAPGPLDVFLTTDRGAYRAGETVHATTLVRDGQADAVRDLPLTAILIRPDGVEYSRIASTDGVAGGHVFNLPVASAAPRGTWRLDIHVDPERPALASQPLLVEDFLPERIDVTPSLPDGPLALDGRPPLRVQADYLFGAPGADLSVEGEVLIAARRTLEDWPGYVFGQPDDSFSGRAASLASARTGADGAVAIPLEFPDFVPPPLPLEARVTVRVTEGSGRPVERRITAPIEREAPVIGIRTRFDETAPEGGPAGFDVIAVGPDGAPVPMQAEWALNRLETRYQWYSEYGDWSWEPVTRRVRVATGRIALGEEPAGIEAPVEWGQYELVVERTDGAYVAASAEFSAGWYAAPDASETPDMLEVSLDRERYAEGDTARLRIVPRFDGTALVTVLTNRLVGMETVAAKAGEETVIELPVTEEWGAGAYVAASLVRGVSETDGRDPVRALGLAHASVDPGARALVASIEAPETARPRTPLDVALNVTGIAPGETAYATIAAVDQGILNLTSFEAPDPREHYFGQQRLGVALRDIYGRLIDGRTGEMGALRSGGDAMAQLRMQAPPPQEELVAYFSGPVEVGEDGTARATFDMPSFNGQVKLMAVVWSASGVGSAEDEVLVRDPVVVNAGLPRFMAPGDTSRLRLELTHAEGPTGIAQVEVTAEGASLDLPDDFGEVELAEGQSRVIEIPVTAGDPGLATIDVSLLPPGAETWRDKPLTLPVEVNDPEIARRTRLSLAPGQTLTLGADAFAGFVPGTGTATVALGPVARFDAPGLLTALGRYPYGCTEQVVSAAMPLLYFSEMASMLDLPGQETVPKRIEGAVTRVLARQSAGGGFGLWQPLDGNLWLDAYATDFLSRARAGGIDVPEEAFTRALDNLQNKVNIAPDFDAGTNEGGVDLAYALMVLAREGKAAIGDLRYYADAKGRDFGTPLAAAQIGAALAMYGDPERADAMFVRAATMLDRTEDPERAIWRSDYGTSLRDAAGLLALAAGAGSEAVDTDALAARVTAPGRTRSTQEAVWTLLAARAVGDAVAASGLEVNGAPAGDALVRVLEDDAARSPLTVTNGGSTETDITLTAFGVPEADEPEGGSGYRIEREYYTTEGAPADPSTVAQGERLVAVLTVTPFGDQEARLMVDDPLPAGFEIDNPNLLRGGDIRELPWLEPAETQHAEFREDRFLAQVDWRSGYPFRIAYIVRAVSPGTYRHPAALVEDMYRPEFRGRTGVGTVTVNE